MLLSGLQQRWAYLQHYRRSEFADALALLPESDAPGSSRELIANYRLGRYQTVAQGQWDRKNMHAGLAMAVSLAYCGKADGAADVVQQMLTGKMKPKLKIALADALSPILPTLALALLGDEQPPLHLRVALLLRNDRIEDAKRLLHGLSEDSLEQFPELHLFSTNAFGGDPSMQLSRINAYLATFNLPTLALRRDSLPPNPTNLLAAAAPRAVTDGPLVTVLMTAFNAQDRIAAALQGLRKQSWQNLEIIVVDDDSSDHTAKVIHDIAKQDTRIRYLRMLQNSGTYAAKMAGLEMARGEFVTCHDSDDWSHPIRVESQMQPLLANSDLVATTSKWIRMQDNGIFYARPVHPLARLNPASPLFRRQAVEQGPGLWDRVRTGADSEFIARLRLYFGRRTVSRLQAPLSFGSHREDSLMTAANTGYSAEGISPQRLEYWEAWNRWHITELRAGRKPSLRDGGRKFPVPASITISGHPSPDAPKPVKQVAAQGSSPIGLV